LAISGIGILGLIPTLVLYRHYYRTRISDYFLMGSAFILAVMQAIVIIMIDTSNETLWLYQVNDILYPTFILMFLIHGSRLRWNKTPITIKLIAMAWYGFIVLSTLFYKITELPDEGQVLSLMA
jgi:hypothetical protein